MTEPERIKPPTIYASRVFSRQGRVHSETANGFAERPGSSATGRTRWRALLTCRTSMLALVISDITNSFSSPRIR